MLSAFSDLGTSWAGKDIFVFNSPWCSLPDHWSAELAVSFQTLSSQYKRQVKDLYKLLLMVKNIGMLSQFHLVIATFLLLSESINIFSLLSIHQFSQNLKELNNLFLKFHFICLT